MSCVLCTMSMMELETKKMLSAQINISNAFHSGAQDTAGSLLAHNSNSFSTNTAITWFHPEGVLGPPCLIPTSKLNGGLFVNPIHGLAERSKFSLTAAATVETVAPLSRSTSPNSQCSVKRTCHVHRDNKQLFSPFVSFPQCFHQKGNNVQALHTGPEAHQLIRERSEFFVQHLPHAHFIHFVQCRNQRYWTPVA